MVLLVVSEQGHETGAGQAEITLWRIKRREKGEDFDFIFITVIQPMELFSDHHLSKI